MGYIKMKISYLVIGLMTLIIVVGIILAINNNNNEKGLNVLVPYVDIEASVISLTLDESENYMEGNEIVSAPKDSALVRIDKIVSSRGDYEFNWQSLGVYDGNEITLGFGYGVRSAKVINAQGIEQRDGDLVGYTVPTKRIYQEDGKFVFGYEMDTINPDTISETILPGLKEGDKFKARILQPLLQEGLIVGKYEIIS